MINILKVDTNKVDIDTACRAAAQLHKALNEEDVVLVLPYSIDVLLDVPIEEIISIRDNLNEIIKSRS